MQLQKLSLMLLLGTTISAPGIFDKITSKADQISYNVTEKGDEVFCQVEQSIVTYPL
jgi:hypothetical protein